MDVSALATARRYATREGASMDTGSALSPVHSARVLIAENSFLVAELVRSHLERHGAVVVASVGSQVEALAAASSFKLDAAVLDLEMRDGGVLGVADRLIAKGVGLVFLRGTGTVFLPPAYASIPVLEKPRGLADLISVLGRVIKKP
ncbi:MAG: response regulator [Planctomycetota bacterium]|nr:response regulator [Planctomycetota bacterium]